MKLEMLAGASDTN